MATWKATQPGQSLYPIVNGAAELGLTPVMANKARPNNVLMAPLRIIANSCVADKPAAERPQRGWRDVAEGRRGVVVQSSAVW